jgi:hypothetical protein
MAAMYVMARICTSAGIPEPTVGLVRGTGRGGMEPSQGERPESSGPFGGAPASSLDGSADEDACTLGAALAAAFADVADTGDALGDSSHA